MKRFTVPCKFGNTTAPFNIYIGQANEDVHPLFYQTNWLSEQRGGVMPTEVIESFQKLANIARENQVSFEDLCVYALGSTDGSAKAEQAAKLKEQQADAGIKPENLNVVRVLASAQELQDSLDDRFSLLHIQFVNEQNEIHQIVLLVREEKVQGIESMVSTGKIDIVSLQQVGLVEHTARGSEIPLPVLDEVRTKYGLTSKEI
jgi:hypothetical protein